MTSSGKVLSFIRPRQWTERDWTQQELAEFYRVEAALIRSGLLVDVERGISDEGDPWFVFCRHDNGEPIAHFARIRDEYVIALGMFPDVARGKDFGLLIRDLMSAYPMSLPRHDRHAQNVFLHPAAMLVALLATAFIISSDGDTHDQHAPASVGKEAVRLISLGEFAILSAVAIATTLVEHQIETILKVIETGHSLAQEDSQITNNAHANHPSADTGTILDSILKLGLHLNSHAFANESSSAYPMIIVDAEGHGNSSPAVQPGLFNDSHNDLHLVTQASDKGQDAGAPINTSTSKISIDIGNHSPWLSLPQVDGQLQTIATQTSSSPTSSTPPHASALVSDQAISVTSASSPGSASSTSSASSVNAANSLGTPTFSTTDAHHALGTDLGSSVNAPVILAAGNVPLDDSVHQVLAHLQAATGPPPPATSNVLQLVNGPLAPVTSGGSAPATGSESVGTGIAIVQPGSALAQSVTSPAQFDSTAQQTLQHFFSATLQWEEDVVGQHIFIVDKSLANGVSTQFDVQSWAFQDGSTLSIVGIVPAPAQAGHIQSH